MLRALGTKCGSSGSGIGLRAYAFGSYSVDGGQSWKPGCRVKPLPAVYNIRSVKF